MHARSSRDIRAEADAARHPARRVTVNHCEAHGLRHLLPGGFVGFETFSRRVPVHTVGRPSLLPALHRPLWARVVRSLIRLLMR